eukprot:CAMPEP_0194061190 /NCGR_PEP_ID=MMETSP0009_2-20130614/73945_1 /TAXON_ID=210454 /ORGANISM="Grammatophora oceanica, Strain CCMP 410" /LENGTH=80 /DNA_ID=CAMNT_0038712417 /DNA_START=48 /DNA_END=286 /DNA_ORIENTATION=+
MDTRRDDVFRYLKPNYDIKKSFLVDSISPTTVSFSLDNRIVWTKEDSKNNDMKKSPEDAIRRYDAIVYRQCDPVWEKHMG